MDNLIDILSEEILSSEEYMKEYNEKVKPLVDKLDKSYLIPMSKTDEEKAKALDCLTSDMLSEIEELAFKWGLKGAMQLKNLDIAKDKRL